MSYVAHGKKQRNIWEKAPLQGSSEKTHIIYTLEIDASQPKRRLADKTSDIEAKKPQRKRHGQTIHPTRRATAHKGQYAAMEA